MLLTVYWTNFLYFPATAVEGETERGPEDREISEDYRGVRLLVMPYT